MPAHQDKKIGRLSDVWRSCNKIRAAVYRVGFNLWEFFKPLDPNKRHIISESQFLYVFFGPLRQFIGLSDEEVLGIADYFKTQDGRIFYAQLCGLIHGEDSVRPPTSDIWKGSKPVCPSEKIKPVNRHFTEDEHRRICSLLATIASRRLIIRPYFQDYELVAKNDGRATFAHFSRVLNFLGVLVSSEDMNLLIKRFLSDAYSIDYEEFLEEVEKVSRMGAQDLVNINPMRQIKSRGMTSEKENLVGDCFPPSGVFHTALESHKEVLITIDGTMDKIKKFVFRNRIRLSEFLQPLDPLDCGRILESQFIKALDQMGLGPLAVEKLTHAELTLVCQTYQDPCDDDMICWRTFENDVNLVFTVQSMEKYPEIDVRDHIRSQINPVPESRRVPDRIKELVNGRAVNLRHLFGDFDKLYCGRVTRNQFRKVLKTAGLRLTPSEICLIEEPFLYDGQFAYRDFLTQIETTKQTADVMEDFKKQLEKACQRPPEIPPHETDIVQVLAKIKNKVVRERIRVSYFLEQFDSLRKLIIPREDFNRGLSTAINNLTQTEIATLMDVFAAPLRRDYVDYVRFCSVIEESFTQKGLQHAPLLVPVPHLANPDSWHNNLNHTERLKACRVMEQFAKYPDDVSNISEVFRDFDKENCGSVSRSKFDRCITVRAMPNFSRDDLDCIYKCFAVKRGSEDEVDYRRFIDALERINNSFKNAGKA